MILRVKVQQGHRVSYTPGWDCHGLPIELKALGEAGGKGMSAVEIRRSAARLASKTVAKQMRSFAKYAVMADWEHSWTTMDKAYELRQLRLFQRMVRQGLIYRRYKPVYWSPSSGTALAEAELEYNENHVSQSAYVRFPLVGDYSGISEHLDLSGGNLFAVVWTTTPWTLPANQAIAVHDDIEYDVIRLKGEKDAMVVASTCVAAFAEALGVSAESVEVLIGGIQGSRLTGLQYANKLHGKAAQPRPVIHAPFVSSQSGTGLVHCAPGHGFDDYHVCSALNMTVSAPVDNEGRLTHEAYPDDPAQLTGASVLEDASDKVLALLGADVVRIHAYTHKYPYDWRTKKPVIMRATAQWFADVAGIKEPALRAVADEVRFVPDTGRARLEAFVKGRSEWCISRQRAWGVPIPALYDVATGEAVMTDETVEHIISVLEERGSSAWWSDAPDDPAWIPAGLRADSRKFGRGTDTMDVWFDSGSSWTMHDKPADMYLEGSDQHRGWFQSSLLTRVAALAGDGQAQEQHPGGTTNTLGLAPFRTLITHGFTLDQDGKKMSKSLGNVISPDQVMDGTLLPPIKPKKKAASATPMHDALGPDALRLWVASSDYTRDMVLGEPGLKAVHQALLKYRTTVKMLLGSLHESSRTAPLTVLDHVALMQLRGVMAEVMAHYDRFEFYKAFGALNRWLTNDLSGFYLEALKDRLYCVDGGGILEPILLGFLRMLAPITPVLVVEAWEHAPAWLKNKE
jgi:isoleucyl-tRNA synthetase